MDEQQAAFLETFRQFMDDLILVPRPQVDVRTPLGDLVQDFLGADVATLPSVSNENILPSRI
ncbi:hypothetical protein [Cryobacterium sp.]|uniref:hypothetical protein n=1 Tax=Cryobacterium sp. TaxID=1926290 RepID=UPI002603EBFF|nr:hypothetical protein [Cryobacterium sp.]MCU1446890.1 family ATPase [Cryobacterium sp.]